MKKNNWVDILIWVIGAEVVGALSALFSGGFADFYAVLERPPLQPPAWVFPIVWTILYAVMGYSAYLISESNAPDKHNALRLYFIQLALNFSWSIVFFRFEELWAAFIVLLFLLAAVIAMVIKFCKISPLAAYINIPYITWLCFAAYLNLATALINA